MKAVALLALLALAVPTLAACGDSSVQAEPAPVPEGFTRYSGTGFSIAIPAGWAPQATKTDADRLVALRPPQGGATRPLLGVSEEHAGAQTDLEAYAAQFSVSQTMRIPGWKASSEDSTPIPGAKEGRLLEAAYHLPGGGPQVRELILFARLSGGRIFVVRAGGEVSAFNAAQDDLRAALESFRPVPSGGSA